MVNVYSCEQVNKSDSIGLGAYGEVYKGHLNNGWYRDPTPVAIKIMKRRTNAIDELKRMSKLDHPNVLKLLGFVPKSNHEDCDCEPGYERGLWLVLEYMPQKDLLRFIKLKPLRAAVMEKMAYQIALGMDYLHRTAKIIHRDLAARNILVGDGGDCVKIADFGLCDGYYEDQYYYKTRGKPCPVRWMPPENLPECRPFVTRGRFSRKGDVWSYAVVLYELWSRGKEPLGLLSPDEVLVAVKEGTTVLNDGTPFHARSWVIQLMKMCFQYDKTKRPNFRQVYEYIMMKRFN